MQKILLLGGFGGSGKSTCAELLWEKLDHVALFGADHLFRIKPFDVSTQEGRETIGRVKLTNSLKVLQTFIDEGYEHIICEGLVWSQAELDAVVEAVTGQECEVYMFWLKTSKEVRHGRAIARARDEADHPDFLELVEKTIKDPTPLTLVSEKSYTIVTDGKTPDEVCDELLGHL